MLIRIAYMPIQSFRSILGRWCTVYFTYISTPSFSLDRTSSRLVLLQATRRHRTTIDPTSSSSSSSPSSSPSSSSSSSSSSSCQRTEATSARDQRPSRSSPQCSSPQTTSGTDKTPNTSSLWSGRACWAALLTLIHHHRASADNPDIVVAKTGRTGCHGGVVLNTATQHRAARSQRSGQLGLQDEPKLRRATVLRVILQF
jgi:hypothetical protein